MTRLPSVFKRLVHCIWRLPLLSPCVKSLKEGAPSKLIHDPTLTLEVMSKRSYIEQKSICYLYAGFDITANFACEEDIVWGSNTIKNLTLANKSLKTGKLIQDIPPLQEIVDKHSIPTQKKRLKNVVSISEQYNLSPQEVVCFPTPFSSLIPI